MVFSYNIMAWARIKKRYEIFPVKIKRIASKNEITQTQMKYDEGMIKIHNIQKLAF